MRKDHPTTQSSWSLNQCQYDIFKINIFFATRSTKHARISDFLPKINGFPVKEMQMKHRNYIVVQVTKPLPKKLIYFC